MSRKGVIHRDLKPENILFNSKSEGVFDIRIADFGYATTINSPKQMTLKMKSLSKSPKNSDYKRKMSNRRTNEVDDVICGTPGYIAPEAIAGEGFSFKSDIFSIGSILFSILTLKNLFVGDDYKQVMTLNKQCNMENLSHKLRKCSSLAREFTR